MIYTLANIRAAARSKDGRLEDVDAYPDTWIDDQIEHAFETAESAVAVFHTSETYDMTLDITNGLIEVEIILQKEPHYIYHVELDNQYLDYSVTGNNHIVVIFKDDAIKSLNKMVTVQYFYYPTLPFVEIEMASEVYHFFRHCLYVNLYGSLRDKESEVYHQSQVDRFVAEGTFPLPFEFDEVQQEKKFRNNTWV